jgi:MFS family permease
MAPDATGAPQAEPDSEPEPGSEPALEPGGDDDELRRRSRAGVRAILADRNFTTYWLATLVSNAGTFMQGIGVPFILYRLTGSNAWVGAAVFANLLPSLLVGPLAGTMTDRFPRRLVLLWANVIQAIAAVGLWVLAALGELTPWRIVALLAVGGVGAGFQYSAAQAIVSLLVPREHLVPALRLNSLGFTGARALGPAAAGFVLDEWGATTTFAVNAISFLVVISALMTLRVKPVPPPTVSESYLSQFRSGIRYTWERPAMRLVVITAFVTALLAQSVVQLAAGIAGETYDVSARGLGLLVTLFGMGSVSGIVILLFVGDRRRRSRVSLTGLVLYGCCCVLSVVTTRYPIGLLAFFLMGTAHVLNGVTLNTTMQAQVDEEFRGRAVTLYLMALLAGMPIGALVLGGIGDLVGLRPTIAASGILLLVYCGHTAWRTNFLAPFDAAPVLPPSTRHR